MNKKLLTLLLLGSMLLTTVLTSCAAEDNTASDGTTAPDTTAAETTAEPVDSLEARASVSDGLPDMDFNGEEFHMVTQTMTITDAWAEAETGDIIEDAVYNRNRTVEERFNVKLTCKDGTYYDNNDYMKAVILSGEDVVDLHFGQGFYSGSLVLDKLMMNWYDIPYIDFEKDWWADSTVETLSYNGICYDAIGDVCLSAMYAAYCVYYDKQMAKDYGLDDLYTVVNDGKWTIDYLSETVKDIYTDVNGNSERDFDDFYGFTSDIRSNITALQWAFDNPIIKKGNDGMPQYVYHTEKISAIVEKLRALIFNNTGTYITKNYTNPQYNTPEGLSREMFLAGNCIIANGFISMAVTHFRQNESDYGIIPQPKWNEAQDGYRAFVDGYHQLLQVPVTVVNTEMLGIVTEALCAESWKTVVPAYYDVALKVKGARDEQSIEMLDLIVNSRIFDFGYIFNLGKGAPTLQSFVPDQTVEFESFYAGKAEAVESFYADVLEMYN